MHTMELAWQIRNEMTRNDICFLETDRISYRCFCCEETLPGHDIWVEIERVRYLPEGEELWLDDDPLDELTAALFDEYGDVMAQSWGLCDHCRDWYVARGL
jgi:hypothetical protein